MVLHYISSGTDKCKTFFKSSILQLRGTFNYKLFSSKLPNLENMSNGGIASSQSLKKKTSLFKIQILVVDDDSTSLAIVSSMLKKCSLQDCMIDLSVVTVKNSLDALSNLRVQNGAFDLVITDLHMPVMNGLELQKQVKEEFKIPVIIMSADDKEKEILKSLESEAAFYMKKPVNPEDLKIVWQYAVASKKGKKVVMEQEIGSGQEETSSNDKLHHISSSSENEESGPKKKKGRKRARDQGQEERDAAPAPAAAAPAPAPPKKAKVIWTNTLHDLFLQAVSHIGLEKAVPKKILEFMNVPGLTRENVASHLQKYRMFLKKVAEKGFWTSRSLAERAFRSSFANGYTSMYQNPHKQFSPFLGQQPSFQSGYGGNLSGFRSSSSGLSRFPSQEAPTSNSVPQLHYGQSSLFGNPTSFQQRPLVFANPCLANRSTSNNSGINLSSDTATQHGLTIGATPMQMQQQQNQANPQSNIIDTPFTLLSTGIGCSSMATSNYAGIILTGDGELIGTGKTRFNGIDLSSGSNNGGIVLMNMTHDNSMNNPPTGNGIFGGLCAQGAGSCSTVLGSTSQFSPTFIATNQENTLMLPPQSQQHTSTGLRNAGGENDLMTNASTLGSISDNHQQELGEVDLDELLFGSPYTTPYQDQNSEVSMNVNLHSSPYQAEVGGSVNEFLNSEFSTLCTIADQTPWSEKSSAQLQGREETVNPDFGGNVNPLEDYYPSFEQPQCNNLEHTLNGMDLDEAPISGNEVWGDDILNFLLGDEVY